MTVDEVCRKGGGYSDRDHNPHRRPLQIPAAPYLDPEQWLIWSHSGTGKGARR